MARYDLTITPAHIAKEKPANQLNIARRSWRIARGDMSRTVTVNSERAGLLQTIQIGPHHLHSDEPPDWGNDGGPDPYELLLASLGACTSMTLRMYADRKQWPLQGVEMRLGHSKIHAKDCATCDTKEVMLDQIDVEISLLGNLSESQRQRLMEIADRCPVHRTLLGEIRIRTRLMVPGSPVQVQHRDAHKTP